MDAACSRGTHTRTCTRLLAPAQVLQLLDDAGNVVAPFLEDHKKLGFYSPHDG